MNTATPRLSLLDLVLAGAVPAAWLGGLEAALWIWGAGPDPALDLATLGFAVGLYAPCGALLSLLLYFPARWLGNASGRPLWPWRGAPHSQAGALRAWCTAQALLWLALVAATANATRLRLPISSWQGLASLAAALLLAAALGLVLVPRAARAMRLGALRLRLAAALLLAGACGLGLPPVLASAVYHAGKIPEVHARRANPADPELAPPPLESQQAPGPPSAERPDVIMITLDTTRADHLSAYGYERDTSPNLERFAAEAVRFDSAWAASSWTVPTHASLFTGMFPHSHGAHYMSGADVQQEKDYTSSRFQTKIRPLDPAHVTLAEILRAYGYRTGAFVGGPYLYSDFGLAQGFDWYDDCFTVSMAPQLALYRWLDGRVLRFQPDWFRFQAGSRTGDRTNAAAEAWLQRVGGDRFFLFLNYFDAHEPYTPQRAYRERYPGSGARYSEEQQKAVFAEVMSGRRAPSAAERAWIASQYDAELRYQDEQMGLLFDFLRRSGRYDEALIVVLADHGESLGEQDQFSHGFGLYAPVTHVPLLVKFPRRDAVPPGTRGYPVHQVDVLPTILKRVGADPALLGAQPLQGRDLFDTSAPHVILSELERDDWKVERFGERWSRTEECWTDGTRRLHQFQGVDAAGTAAGAPRLELYDVAADPLELQPLAPDGAEALRGALQRWLDAARPFLASEWIRHIDVSGAGGALSETGYGGDASGAEEQ